MRYFFGGIEKVLSLMIFADSWSLVDDLDGFVDGYWWILRMDFGG